MDTLPEDSFLLVVRRLAVQNANALSSPLTWGFPSMTAFLGLMWDLKRKTAASCALEFHAVGVVCHRFEPQVARTGRTCQFRLNRNPLNKDGGDAAIVEEGRAHLGISLVFAVAGNALHTNDEKRRELALRVYETLTELRVAGGVIIPSQQTPAPEILPLDDKNGEAMRKFRYSLLPGFSLILRQDLLHNRLEELRALNPQTSSLDAWLDLARLNRYAEAETDREDGAAAKATWSVKRKPGWLVPIPVGYTALSEIYPGGKVLNARDQTTPFRFVENVYSIGQWISPHHLGNIQEMLWQADYDASKNLYLCRNDNHVGSKHKREA